MTSTRVAICFLAAFALAGPAPAEPDSAVQFLMSQRVSMLDWGVRELEDSLEGLSLAHGAIPISTTARYDWEENRINITSYALFLNGIDPPTRAQAKALAKETIERVRATLFVDPKTGKWIGDRCMLSMYFSHSGYSEGEEPEDLCKRLANITKITAHVRYKGDAPGELTASGSLSSAEVMFNE